ncbi:MAG TPA: RagB/SusD family nutrient uptake outer membrane protein [Ferruginibacter sp.]|nr:RagB/SusD family nutrient uptake outer membrane protein [Ferruginibacter sp.]
MKHFQIFYILIILFFTGSFISCKKYLETKPDKKLVTPSTLADLQAILDYTPNMIVATYSDEASADNYYLTTGDWGNVADEGQRRMYSWEKDNFYMGISSDWGLAYRKVYYANTVLDALPGIEVNPAKKNERDNIKGQALFIRATTFWNIARIWSLAYDINNSSTDRGIPLRLNADFNEHSVRASVKETYERILFDLKSAAPLLPLIPIHPVRASRVAAYGYLSKVYLSMRNYELAGLYADSCLQYNNRLLNYNTLDSNAALPFRPFNVETIFYTVSGQSLISPSIARIDSLLYQSYAANDLRRIMFFKKNVNGSVNFKGTYSGSGDLFSGLATDEMYLTRAECFARAGNTASAMNDLNFLLITRFKTATFVPRVAVDAADALKQILSERRKELVMRFTRWIDIKRLNKEGANITLTRILNNQAYTLSPNSLRYALPLPEDVLALSGMEQNPR